MPSLTFGQRLMLARRDKQLTQAQLGHMIGVSSQQISRLETSAAPKLSVERARALAAALEVSIGYLLADEHEAASESE
jgi:transcriptional regulator with XRE-family HTH domain